MEKSATREEPVGRWLITAADFVTTGGMDIANWHLARWLANKHPVELVSHRVDEPLASTPGITITRVARPRGMNLLGEPLLRRKGLQRARSLGPEDHVVGNGGNLPTPDINWVHYVHSAFNPISAGNLLRRAKTRYHHWQSVRTERLAFQTARVIVCNSQLSARHIIEKVGIPPERTRVVYYGSDPETLAPVSDADRIAFRQQMGWSDQPRAVFVGALGDRRKGFDVLYDAWKQLAQGPWDVHLAVIGRGAELDAWRQRAEVDGLAKLIEFLGFRNDVPRVLAACDVMVHPARYEAYGLGVHEAVCRGLPAIVSAEAGVAERLSDPLHELLLPNPEDVSALVDRLRHWRANLDSYRTRTAPLAERLRHHTWDDMASSFYTAVT